MPVLVIEPVPQSRETLRRFLREFRQTLILEAKNETDGLRALVQNQTRLSFILLSESALPLLPKIAELPFLRSVPLLLLGGRTSFEKYPRIDAFLEKPFGMKGLERAMVHAYIQRTQCRDLLVILSDQSQYTLRCTEVLRSEKRCLFQTLLPIKSESEFSYKIRLVKDEVSALLIDAKSIRNFSKNWLTQFKKSPQGQKTSVFCLGKDPEDISSLRNHAELFFDEPKDAKELLAVLKSIQNHLYTRWEADCILSLLKNAKRTDTEIHEKLVKKSLSVLPSHPNSLYLIADYYRRNGDHAKAMHFYESSIELNPVVPSAHLGLLETLFEIRNFAELEQVLKRASRYCPEHPQTKEIVSALSENLRQESLNRKKHAS